jgi:hypothetical protein
MSADRYVCRFPVPRDREGDSATTATLEADAHEQVAAKGYTVIDTRRYRDESGIVWIEVEGIHSHTGQE